MLCSDTSAKMKAVKIGVPLDVAEYIAKWLESIKPFGGNANLTLCARGGNIEGYEHSMKDKRQRKKSA